MTNHLVYLTKTAEKELNRLTSSDQKKIVKVVHELQTDIFSDKLNIKKMKAATKTWRVRAENLRLIYTLKSQITLVITSIGYRGKIY